MYTHDSHVALQGPVFGPGQFSWYVFMPLLENLSILVKFTNTTLSVKTLFFRYFPPETRR